MQVGLTASLGAYTDCRRPSHLRRGRPCMRQGIGGIACRLGWAGCLVGMTLGVAADVVAQSTPKVYRIGWLGNGNPPAGKANVADFEQGLTDRGYVDRKTVLIEYQYAHGDPAQLARLAAELERLKVDVIVTAGEPAALAAQRATSTIPIIATEFGFDPVKAGLVASLGKPEGNVTGSQPQRGALGKAAGPRSRCSCQTSRGCRCCGIPPIPATSHVSPRSGAQQRPWVCRSWHWRRGMAPPCSGPAASPGTPPTPG